MGNSSSRQDAYTLEASLCTGDLLWSTAGVVSLQPYMLKAAGWHEFGACSIIVRDGPGLQGLSVVTAHPQRNGAVISMLKLKDVLASCTEAAVTLLEPKLSPAETKQIQLFAATVLAKQQLPASPLDSQNLGSMETAPLDKRVQMLLAHGFSSRKVFCSKLAADALLSAGRVQRVDGMYGAKCSLTNAHGLCLSVPHFLLLPQQDSKPQQRQQQQQQQQPPQKQRQQQLQQRQTDNAKTPSLPQQRVSSGSGSSGGHTQLQQRSPSQPQQQPIALTAAALITRDVIVTRTVGSGTIFQSVSLPPSAPSSRKALLPATAAATGADAPKRRSRGGSSSPPISRSVGDTGARPSVDGAFIMDSHCATPEFLSTDLHSSNASSLVGCTCVGGSGVPHEGSGSAGQQHVPEPSAASSILSKVVTCRRTATRSADLDALQPDLSLQTYAQSQPQTDAAAAAPAPAAAAAPVARAERGTAVLWSTSRLNKHLGYERSSAGNVSSGARARAGASGSIAASSQPAMSSAPREPSPQLNSAAGLPTAAAAMSGAARAASGELHSAAVCEHARPSPFALSAVQLPLTASGDAGNALSVIAATADSGKAAPGIASSNVSSQISRPLTQHSQSRQLSGSQLSAAPSQPACAEVLSCGVSSCFCYVAASITSGTASPGLIKLSSKFFGTADTPRPGMQNPPTSSGSTNPASAPGTATAVGSSTVDADVYHGDLPLLSATAAQAAAALASKPQNGLQAGNSTVLTHHSKQPSGMSAWTIGSNPSSKVIALAGESVGGTSAPANLGASLGQPLFNVSPTTSGHFTSPTATPAKRTVSDGSSAGGSDKVGTSPASLTGINTPPHGSSRHSSGRGRVKQASTDSTSSSGIFSTPVQTPSSSQRMSSANGASVSPANSAGSGKQGQASSAASAATAAAAATAAQPSLFSLGGLSRLLQRSKSPPPAPPAALVMAKAF